MHCVPVDRDHNRTNQPSSGAVDGLRDATSRWVTPLTENDESTKAMTRSRRSRDEHQRVAIAMSMIEVCSMSLSMRVKSVGVVDGGDVSHRDETRMASRWSWKPNGTHRQLERNPFEDDR